MVLKLQIGLVGIPIMLLNSSNSRYATNGMKMFSSCCNEAVGMKKYCKGCGKDLINTEILKGISKDTILSQEQSEKLKEHLEGGLMSVLKIEEVTETTTYDLIPYIQKVQYILPSISKGFKKSDLVTYFSFTNALKDLNKFCIVKLTQRATEHIGVVINYKDSLVFIEIPFASYKNDYDVDRLKTAVVNQIRVEKIENPIAYKEEAIKFINSFENKEESIDLIKEEKIVLLKQMINDIQNGVDTTPEIIKQEVNPFAV